MAEIVNLNKVRKARLKTCSAALAKQNRIIFGQTRSERLASETDRIRRETALDQHRLDKP